jgi:hypothetical protein
VNVARLTLVIARQRTHLIKMDVFDYTAPAELFHPIRLGNRAPLSFRRFATSAEAIKFAIEQLSPAAFHGAVLEIEESRFDGALIRELYESGSFPLGRRSA